MVIFRLKSCTYNTFVSEIENACLNNNHTKNNLNIPLFTGLQEPQYIVAPCFSVQ